MMVIGIKQHLSNIWNWVEKKRCIYKKACIKISRNFSFF